MKYKGTDFSANSNINTSIEFKRVRGRDRKKRQKRYRNYVVKGALGLAALGATNKLMGTKPGQFINISRSNLKSAGKAAVGGAVTGSVLGAAYYGADHARGNFTRDTTKIIQFGRGKDKKKRKRRGTAIDAGVATGAAVTSGALAYRGSIRRDRRQFDAEVAADANKVLERSRNNPLNRESFENLDNLTSRQSIAQDAQNKLSALNQQLEGQPNLNPKLAQRAREKLSAKYGNITQELPSLGKQITDAKGKIFASEKLRSANKLRASRLALAGAAAAGAGGYLASRAIRRRRDK